MHKEVSQNLHLQKLVQDLKGRIQGNSLFAANGYFQEVTHDIIHRIMTASDYKKHVVTREDVDTLIKHAESFKHEQKEEILGRKEKK